MAGSAGADTIPVLFTCFRTVTVQALCLAIEDRCALRSVEGRNPGPDLEQRAQECVRETHPPGPLPETPLWQHSSHRLVLFRDMVRVGPGRPGLMLGVRTALATAAPLLVAPIIGATVAAQASLGGFGVALGDKGGSYRARAIMLGSVTVFASIGTTLAALLAGNTVAATLGMGVWAAVCAFVGAIGPAAAAGGTAVAVQFALSLGYGPASPALAVERGVALGIGGVWAMVLALILWPIRVYKPARHAVGAAFRALAAQAERRGPEGHFAVREAIENARRVLSATRRGRGGESGRGERLLILAQIADLMFGSLVTLEEVVDSAVAAGAPPTVRAAFDAASAGLAATLRDVAVRVESEPRMAPPAPLSWGPADFFALAGHATGEAWGTHDEHAAALVARLGDASRIALDTATSLYGEERPASDPAMRAPTAAVLQGGTEATPDDEQPVLEVLRAELTPESVFFRHAVRVGVTAACAVALTRALGLHRDTWVTLTVLLLLQPYVPATMTRALQRLAGTVLGGILAAVIIAGLGGPLLLIGVAALLAGLSAAVLALNYALFSTLVTPALILLAEVGAKEPHLVELRILNTLIGAALATVGALLLWPHRERRRFPEEAANTIAALRDYVREMIRVVIEGVPDPMLALRAHRRRVSLAANHADASFQRVLAESPPGSESLEPQMTLLLYIRSVAVTVLAAASARELDEGPLSPEATRAFGAEVDSALVVVETALRSGQRPGPLPDLDPHVERIHSPHLAARFARMAQQLTILHHAAER